PWPVSSVSTSKTASGVFSGTGGSERRCDLLDGLGLSGAHALPFLLVRFRDLARESEDEAPVIVEFPGRCLALEQCHRVTEVLQSVLPEFCGRVIPRVECRRGAGVSGNARLR